jgi:muconolactone D-isomerase
MEYFVDFELAIPEGTAESVVSGRLAAEATAAASLAEQRRLIRLWKTPAESHAVGLFRADDKAELDVLLAALPLADWLTMSVTALEPHPNDPGDPQERSGR